MYLMVDVAPNHFGYAGSTNIDYSKFASPFNTADAFHSLCWITDYNNQSLVENCWLGDSTVALVDVNTTKDWVVEKMKSWIKSLVSTYKIDGIRIDTAKHLDKAFLTNFSEASGVFATGEVYHGDIAYTCPYQGYVDGLLDYPM